MIITTDMKELIFTDPDKSHMYCGHEPTCGQYLHGKCTESLFITVFEQRETTKDS